MLFSAFSMPVQNLVVIVSALLATAVLFMFGLVGDSIRSRYGFLMGFLFGPFGLLLAAVLRCADLLVEIRNS